MGYYICLDCGNIESFRWKSEGREYFTAIELRDGEGDWQDDLDKDYDGSDTDDSNIQDCYECESENVQEFDTLEEAKKAYEDKNKPKSLKQFIEEKK